jgi:hypothetical protein
MFGKRIRFCLILFVLLSGIVFALHAQTTQPGASVDLIQLRLNTEEAEAVLAILDKLKIGQAVDESDWLRLFATEPYARLKKREAAMNRDFTDQDFKKFVLSAELLAKDSALRETLNAWKQKGLVASARRDLSYLPEQAVIKAKVFPMIKPKTNSFVFDTDTDPTIRQRGVRPQHGFHNQYHHAFRNQRFSRLFLGLRAQQRHGCQKFFR